MKAFLYIYTKPPVDREQRFFLVGMGLKSSNIRAATAYPKDLFSYRIPFHALLSLVEPVYLLGSDSSPAFVNALF